MDEILGLFSLLIIITIFYIIKRFLNRLFTNKRCAWCKSPSLKFISGEIGNWHWHYRNKDGTKDKRVKGNYQIASYTSQYECKKCNAKTKFEHFTTKKPSKKAKIWLRTLVIEGSGERTGKNWESKKGIKYSSSEVNRKNS